MRLKTNVVKKLKEAQKNTLISRWTKTLIKGVVHNHKRNNITRADEEMAKDLIKEVEK